MSAVVTDHGGVTAWMHWHCSCKLLTTVSIAYHKHDCADHDKLLPGSAIDTIGCVTDMSSRLAVGLLSDYTVTVTPGVTIFVSVPCMGHLQLRILLILHNQVKQSMSSAAVRQTG